MRTVTLLLALLATCLVSAQATAEKPVPTDVHLFYYPWYGNPDTYGAYRHWQQGGHAPPERIGADFYPALGAYDSGDVAGTVEQHMVWVRRSGAGVIAVSWWGQGSYEDGLTPALLEAAARHGVEVAWHLEPYAGRTAESTVSDINHIHSRYGSSPAFYRDGGRGAFYVFNSVAISDWSALESVRSTSIVLAQSTDTGRLAHFGGAYTYDVVGGATAPGWKSAAEHCRAHGLVWAPSVGPGYIDDRAVPGNTTPTLPRDGGAAYDRQWTNALDPATGGTPDWVSVTSFNEWHEGTTIEPARVKPGYQSYEGAYGKAGAEAETAYLDRTRHWVDLFTSSGPPRPVEVRQALGGA